MKNVSSTKKSVLGTYIQLTTGVTVQTHSLFGDSFARNEKTSTDNGFAHVHQNCINQKWHQFF